MSQPAANDRDTAFETASRSGSAIAGSGTIACGLAACVTAHGGRRRDVGPQRGLGAARAQGAEPSATGTKLDRHDATGDALAAATLVVEAVAEEPAVKRELLAVAAASCCPTGRCSRARPPR